MDAVPPLVFSEIMRDVDLFVSVANAANDPLWEHRLDRRQWVFTYGDDGKGDFRGSRPTPRRKPSNGIGRVIPDSTRLPIELEIDPLSSLPGNGLAIDDARLEFPTQDGPQSATVKNASWLRVHHSWVGDRAVWQYRELDLDPAFNAFQQGFSRPLRIDSDHRYHIPLRAHVAR